MHFLHNDQDFTVGYIQYDVTHFGIVLYILCINKHLYKEIEHNTEIKISDSILKIEILNNEKSK